MMRKGRRFISLCSNRFSAVMFKISSRTRIFPAITGATMPEHVTALGIFETFSVATMITAADQILKAAELESIEIRLGTGLGGKSFFTFTGDVAAVETGVEAGRAVAEAKGLMVDAEVIPSPSDRLVPSVL